MTDNRESNKICCKDLIDFKNYIPEPEDIETIKIYNIRISIHVLVHNCYPRHGVSPWDMASLLWPRIN